MRQQRRAAHGAGELAVLVAFACAVLGCEERASAPGGELAPGVTLAGRVLDERGQPLARAAVTAETLARVPGFAAKAERRSTATDEQGAFRFTELLGGALALVASSPDHRQARLELGTLAWGDARAGLELVLADGHALGGRVRRSDGAEAPGAAVRIESEDRLESRALRCDARGGFVARGLGAGPFRVRARAEGELVTLRAVPADALALELGLRVPGALEVVCAGEASAAPSCDVLDEDGNLARAVSDDPEADDARPEGLRGRAVPEPTGAGFRVRGLEPGAYWLRLADEEHSRAALGRVEVAAGATQRVEVALAPATRLELRAPCATSPCVGELELCTDAGYRDRASFLTCIGAAGWYEEHVLLPPGTYHLAWTTDDGRGAADVTLAGEAVRELVMELH